MKNIKKLKDKLGKFSTVLAERDFLTFFGLFIISLLFGSLLFYKYIFLVERTEPKKTGTAIQIDAQKYEKVLKIREDKEKKFQEADSKQYPNPFK